MIFECVGMGGEDGGGGDAVKCAGRRDARAGTIVAIE